MLFVLCFRNYLEEFSLKFIIKGYAIKDIIIKKLVLGGEQWIYH